MYKFFGPVIVTSVLGGRGATLGLVSLTYQIKDEALGNDSWRYNHQLQELLHSVLMTGYGPDNDSGHCCHKTW